MIGFSRRQLIKGLAAIFGILGISWLAVDYFIPSPPSKITIATGFKGSSFEYFGQRYRERLAARAGVAVELRETAGACLLYTSPSPRDGLLSRMPSSA